MGVERHGVTVRDVLFLLRSPASGRSPRAASCARTSSRSSSRSTTPAPCISSTRPRRTTGPSPRSRAAASRPRRGPGPRRRTSTSRAAATGTPWRSRSSSPARRGGARPANRPRAARTASRRPASRGRTRARAASREEFNVDVRRRILINTPRRLEVPPLLRGGGVAQARRVLRERDGRARDGDVRRRERTRTLPFNLKP